MKIFDKLKNALFEEEYVEIEEKPKVKPIKKEKRKKEKRDLAKKQEMVSKLDETGEKPIAKKIAPPKKIEEKPIKEETPVPKKEVENIIDDAPPKRRTDFRFPVVEDKDFKTDNFNVDLPEFIEKKAYEKPTEEPTLETSKQIEKPKKAEKKALYQAKNDDLDYDVETYEYGLYEKQHEKAYFKPSPIISPIYGVLDKNYKKEEVKDKTEVRLTSSYARDRINFDDVRKKAFGSLSDDIDRGPVLEKVDPVEDDENTEEIETEENILFDLRDNDEAPEVNKVTVGDAEEYFQDLGLEYNNDYIDTSKDKVKKEKTESPMIEVSDDDGKEEAEFEKSNIIEEDESLASTEKKEDTDSLFDLIDSMYDDV